MKNLILSFTILILCGVLADQMYANDRREKIIGKSIEFINNDFWIYEDIRSPKNHYNPSGWMGDYGDLKTSLGDTKNPHSGKTCIKITYSAKGTQGIGWAGIYWQSYPANEPEYKKSWTYNFTGANKVKFLARGERGGELIKEFRIGGIMGEYEDSTMVKIGPIKLGTKWQEYEIDLEGKDLTFISGGFSFIADKISNSKGMIFYLDDIVFTRDRNAVNSEARKEIN